MRSDSWTVRHLPDSGRTESVTLPTAGLPMRQNVIFLLDMNLLRRNTDKACAGGRIGRPLRHERMTDVPLEPDPGIRRMAAVPERRPATRRPRRPNAGRHRPQPHPDPPGGMAWAVSRDGQQVLTIVMQMPNSCTATSYHVALQNYSYIGSEGRIET